MLGFVLRRLAWAIVLFFALTLYTYVLFFVIPGNEDAIRRGFRGDQGTTLRETVGIDGGSILQEYGSFVSHVVQGDLGNSQRNRQPVIEIIGRAAPVTMSLVIGGARRLAPDRAPDRAHLRAAAALAARPRAAWSSCSSASPRTRSGSA